MKEMVGACCVCADANGWDENPLVYCDGLDCSVAVHQGCYGILTVPDGNWYCAKCSKAENKQVKCELCPSEEGALKQTDTGGWTHVICALYIPEVRFGDVNSMEPVLLGSVPPDRFNKTCYICEARGNEANSKYGACMQCNKPLCKKYFHVTCAQQKGLLCEEGGGSKNVTYCGYCSHHFKKIINEPGIKRIPPYRPLISGTSSAGSGTSTPDLLTKKEKRANGPTPVPISATLNSVAIPQENNSHHEHSPSAPHMYNSVGASLPPAPVQPLVPTSSTQLVKSGFPTNLDLFSSAAVTAVVRENGPTSVSLSSAHSTSHSSANSLSTVSGHSVAPPPASVAALPGAAAVPLSASVNSVAAGAGGSSTPVSVNVPQTLLVSPSPSSAGGVGNSELVSPSVLPGKTLLKRPRQPLDKEQRIKRPRKAPKSKQTVKSLLESVSHVVEDTVSSFQAERVSERVAAAASNSQAAASQMPPFSPASVSGSRFSNINENPQESSAAPTAFESSLPAFASLAESSYIPSLGVPFKPVARHGAGGAEGTTHLPSSLEQLLERQWEQGSQYLMDQAQHFDVASLLSCLNQLKGENARLEENIVNLGSRRDHLLAVNARLTMTLQPSQPSPHSPRLLAQDPSAESSPSSALSHMRSLTTTMSPSQGFQGKTKYTQVSSATPVISPTARGAVATSTAAPSGYASIGSGSGVFTSVGRQPTKSSDSLENPAAGGFLVPRTPTPLLAGSNPANSLAALTQYSALSSQDANVMQLLLQQQQQQQAAAQALYGSAALSGLMQPPSPHRSAVASLAAASTHSTVTSAGSQQKA